MPARFSKALVVGVFTVGLLAPAQAQTNATSHQFTSSDGAGLHYVEAGAGPLVVFVPGWTMPAEIWQAQMDHFAIDHRVVAFDPRGQGRSEKVNYGYHVERRARDIGDLLARLGDEPAILVGWSLGAHEVLEYTRQAGTERVAGVIVVDHPILADWSKSAAFSTRYAEVQTNREDWIRAFVRRIFATPQSEQYMEAITAAALSTPPNATAVMISNLILMDTGDLTPAVKALDRPMLFVTAQNRPAQWTADVREHKPDAEVFAVADAGHALFVDRAMQFNEAVGDFIRRVTGR